MGLKPVAAGQPRVHEEARIGPDHRLSLEMLYEILKQPSESLLPDEGIHQRLGRRSVRDPQRTEILRGELALLLGLGGELDEPLATHSKR